MVTVLFLFCERCKTGVYFGTDRHDNKKPSQALKNDTGRLPNSGKGGHVIQQYCYIL